MPLPIDVGWAIIDYLRNGRPITEYPNIFVVHNAPYAGRPFKSTLRTNINKAVKRAGIPIDKTKHYGWHSLRHSLAANLLQNNVEISMSKTSMAKAASRSAPEKDVMLVDFAEEPPSQYDEIILAVSCKKRNFCPSCHQKRVIEFGEQLHEEVRDSFRY